MRKGKEMEEEMKRKPGAPIGNQHGLKGPVKAAVNLNIRLMPTDRDMIRAKAKAAGMTVTDWILMLARQAP